MILPVTFEEIGDLRAAYHEYSRFRLRNKEDHYELTRLLNVTSDDMWYDESKNNRTEVDLSPKQWRTLKAAVETELAAARRDSVASSIKIYSRLHALLLTLELPMLVLEADTEPALTPRG